MNELLRFHLTAIGLQIVIDAAVLAPIGFAALDQMSTATAQLVGMSVAIVSMLVGYGFAIQRLRGGDRR